MAKRSIKRVFELALRRLQAQRMTISKAQYSPWMFWKFSKFTKIQNIQRPTSSPAGAGTAHWRAVRGACDGLRARNVTGTSPVPCGSGTWLMIYQNWNGVPGSAEATQDVEMSLGGELASQH